MSAIPGTNVSAPIVPQDSADTFPTHDERYGRGGFRAVQSLAHRDAIPVDRRKHGMRVRVMDQNHEYQLTKDDSNVLDLGTWVDVPEFVDLSRLSSMMPGSDLLNPALHSLVATSGDLGAFVLAFLDAAGYLGVGITKDGTVAASKIRALVSLIAPLVSTSQLNVSNLGQMLLGTGAQVTFAGDGKISGVNGATISLTKANYDFVICDANNNVMFGLLNGKIYGFHSIMSGSDKRLNITFGTGVQIDLGAHNYDFAICDTNGYPLIGWMNGVFYSPGATGDDAMLDTEDLRNKEYTSKINSLDFRGVARPQVNFYSFKTVYGQSLGQADESWPALSTANKYGNLMIGGNVQSTNAVTWVPFDDALLHPLVAQVVDGSTKFSDADCAAFTPGLGGHRGEPVNHGWLNGAKYLLNDHLLTSNDTTRMFVTANIAVSGATIGELTKGHNEGTNEDYNKYVTVLAAMKTAAGATPWLVDGLMYMQGEHDSVVATGHTSTHMTYATYRAALTQMRKDMQADAIASSGQTYPPAFMIYQTGAAYANDVDVNGLPGLHVAMAQLDFSNQDPTTVMVGPVYPYPDKGGHLDSNGYRWFGHQIAKIYHRCIVKGKAWKPLQPIRLWTSGKRIIYVSYHVPVAPLVLDKVFNVNNLSDYAAKGFRVADATSDIGITSVEVIRDTIIKLTLSRDMVGTPNVWCGSKVAAGGNTCIRDSDPAVASENYIYKPEGGMYASANIPAFVDKPYPLFNWSVCWYLPAVWRMS